MDQARSKTVHVGSAWRMLLRDLSLDEVTILRRAGLSPSLFDGDGSHISLEDYYRLHEAVEEESDDPTLALRAGKVVSIELFDPALFSAICSPDMNTAVARLGQFKRLVGPFSLDVEVGADATRVRYRCKHRPDVPMTRGLSEMVFLVAFARRATRHEVRPLEVTVQRLPSDRTAYNTYFGCPLAQGEDCTVVFAPRDGRRPFLTHNARMWEAFEPQLRQRMDEAARVRSTAERVEAALFQLLPSGRAHIRHVAKELGVGTRTLQRRLSAENTTWLDVLNQTRERLARHYLRTTELTPAEVSFLLGFEDPNSLFRAFQRWTGTTPESWRTMARATG